MSSQSKCSSSCHTLLRCRNKTENWGYSVWQFDGAADCQLSQWRFWLL